MPPRSSPSRASSKAAPVPEADFETCFARLEELVAAMEGEDLPLEKLLDHHEEGSRLIERCQNLLAAAEKRISEVRLEAKSAPPLPGEPDQPGEINSVDAPSSGSDPDDISLF